MTRIANRFRARFSALSALCLTWVVAACEPESLTDAPLDTTDAGAPSLLPRAAAVDARENLRRASPVDPCSDAVEPNDTRGQAWLVDVDERIPATVCDGDVDWLAIDLPEAETVSVRVESQHVDRLSPIEAFRPRARKPFGKLSSASNAMELQLNDVRPGRYRVRVAPRDGQPPTAYTCVVRVSSAGSR
jgi:hypothetical protein